MKYSWWGLTTAIPSRRATQRGTRDPGCFKGSLMTSWYLLGEGDNERRDSSGPHPCKCRRNVQGWERWRQPCLQWPWNCEADFLRERKRRMAGWQSNRLWPIQGPTWKNSMGYCPGKKRLKRAGWFSASSSLKNGPCKCAEKSSKSNRRPTWMIKEILNKFRHKKAARADDPGGI